MHQPILLSAVVGVTAQQLPDELLSCMANLWLSALYNQKYKAFLQLDDLNMYWLLQEMLSYEEEACLRRIQLKPSLWQYRLFLTGILWSYKTLKYEAIPAKHLVDTPQQVFEWIKRLGIKNPTWTKRTKPTWYYKEKQKYDATTSNPCC